MLLILLRVDVLMVMMMMMMMMMMNYWWWWWWWIIDDDNVLMMVILIGNSIIDDWISWCQWCWYHHDATMIATSITLDEWTERQASVSPAEIAICGDPPFLNRTIIYIIIIFFLFVISYSQCIPYKSCWFPHQIPFTAGGLSKASELELLKKQLGMEPRTSGSTRDWKAQKVEEHQFLWVKCKVCLLTCCCRSKDS